MKILKHPYMAPAGEGGEGDGAPPDRGDEIPPIDKALEDDGAAAKAADDAKAAAAADDEGKKEITIPKSRFDEAVQKERAEKAALEARVKAFEEQAAQARVADDFAEANKQVKEMIKQHSSLLADGELDKASDLMERILAVKEVIAERKAEVKAETVKTQTKDEVRYDALVAKIEADYPQINPDSPEFDKDKVVEVQVEMSGLMQVMKLTPTQALAKAVDKVFASTKKADASEEATAVGMRRKEAAVKKALDAKGKQPASTTSVGLDHDKEGGALDASAVMKMSYEEFVKLPESKLSELRGDHI